MLYLAKPTKLFLCSFEKFCNILTLDFPLCFSTIKGLKTINTTLLF